MKKVLAANGIYIFMLGIKLKLSEMIINDLI